MGDMVILSPQEYFLWNEFVLGNSFPESFLQSTFWPAERFFVVVEKDEAGNITEGAGVEERKIWIGKAVWLVRRAPLAESRIKNQESRIEDLFYFLVERARQQGNVMMIRFQSLFPERSKAESKEYINETLRQAQRVTTCPPKFLVHIEDPKKTLLVDLRFSEEELLREMHEKTRYNIHLAERKGVVVREGNLEEFYSLYEDTNKRKGLKGFSREYFEKLLLTRHPGTKAEMTEGGGYTIKIFTAYYNNTPLASNFLVGFGSTVTYLFGGSSDQYRELMAPHLLHWECIKWAKRNGYEWYDWWGIESQSTGGSQQLTKMHGLRDWEGITRFKRSFVSEKTGKVVEFGETKDVVIEEGWYRIFSFMKKLLVLL